jgi:stress response protein SCP2
MDSVSKKCWVVSYTQKGPGVTHGGDNLTVHDNGFWEGDGDDETIRLDLQHVPPSISKLAVIVNIYSPGVSFNEVSDAYVRLCVAKYPEQERANSLLAGQVRGYSILDKC